MDICTLRHILKLHAHGCWSCLRAPIQGHNTAWLVIFPVVRFDVSCNDPEQFAELVYSAVPVNFLIENHTTLSRSNYPLENYDAVRDCIFIDAFRGTCADLPAFIVFRPISRQLVVSISGSASIVHMLYNLRFRITAHPSGHGQVHTGFLHLYEGIREMLFDRIRQGVAKHSPTELILTGHSSGCEYCISVHGWAARLRRPHPIGIEATHMHFW